ncbi:MAG: hypothetical protein PUB86_04910 [Elusimicrobia bacterium]|nr:hypothetical protein [Elusimicrobiota bacterium]
MKSLKIKYLWLLLVFILPVLCFAETCPGFNLIEYKPDESCGDLERKCCIDLNTTGLGKWSDWGRECEACTPGAYTKVLCSFYYNNPYYDGIMGFTCNSDSKWEVYAPASQQCIPPDYIQFMLHITTPLNYHFTSIQNCSDPYPLSANGPMYVPINLTLETEKEVSSGDGFHWVVHMFLSDVVALRGGAAYDLYGDICFSHKLSNGTIEYVPVKLNYRFSTIVCCTNCVGCESSWDKPRTLTYDGGMPISK